MFLTKMGVHLDVFVLYCDTVRVKLGKTKCSLSHGTQIVYYVRGRVKLRYHWSFET